MFFYTVSFPSCLVLFRRPQCWLCLGGTSWGHSPDLQSGAESKRRQRERHPYRSVTQAPSLAHRHTPWRGSLPWDHPSEAQWKSVPVDASTMPEKRVPWGPTFISTRMPTTCLEPGLDLPGTHLPAAPGKSICGRLPSASCNSNDKVITG